MKNKNTISEFIYPIKIKSLCHAYKQILSGSSIMRLIHNYFLRNVNINTKVLDLGSSNISSYYNFLNKSLKYKINFVDKNILKKNKNYIKADLEKTIKIQNEQYDTVLMFNILEHLKNDKDNKL
jgi:hypothetical protein